MARRLCSLLALCGLAVLLLAHETAAAKKKATTIPSKGEPGPVGQGMRTKDDHYIGMN